MGVSENICSSSLDRPRLRGNPFGAIEQKNLCLFEDSHGINAMKQFMVGGML